MAIHAVGLLARLFERKQPFALLQYFAQGFAQAVQFLARGTRLHGGEVFLAPLHQDQTQPGLVIGVILCGAELDAPAAPPSTTPTTPTTTAPAA